MLMQFSCGFFEFSLFFSTNITKQICYPFWFVGFHLSATVVGTQPRSQFNVAVTFDRRRISSCNCTCSSAAYWCSHVVAVCLHRIHCVSFVFIKRKIRIFLRKMCVLNLLCFFFVSFSHTRFAYVPQFRSLWHVCNVINYRNSLNI